LNISYINAHTQIKEGQSSI